MEDTRINVENIEDLRITYVNYYRNIIRFKLGKERYEIFQEVASEPFEKRPIIYKRYSQRYNVYIQVDSVETDAVLSSFIVDISKVIRSNINYGNIDKAYFVKWMTKIGIMESKYNKLCELNDKEQADFDVRIEELQKQLNDLRKAKEKMYNERMGTTGHGSKIYGEKLKAKISDRICGTGFKEGDFIQKFNARIGDRCPSHGGILTDLRNLMYGTFFECKNGMWCGRISCNEHGDKTVHVLDTDTNNVIDEVNCIQYIEIIN